MPTQRLAQTTKWGSEARLTSRAQAEDSLTDYNGETLIDIPKFTRSAALCRAILTARLPPPYPQTAISLGLGYEFPFLSAADASHTLRSLSTIS